MLEGLERIAPPPTILDSSIDTDHEKALQLMIDGSLRPLSQIVDDLSRPDHTLESLTYFLGEFITRRPLWRMKGEVHPNSAIYRFAEAHVGKRRASFVRELIERPIKKDSFPFKIIELFELDYGDIRKTFDYLVHQVDSYGVCYFDKFVFSVANLAKRNDWKKNPRTMFDGSFFRTVKDLVEQGIRLEELSGMTNTKLELYEWTFSGSAASANGFADVKKSAYDVGYDLGGGFTTQYLAERFGQPLICLDLFDPKIRSPYEHNNLDFQYKMHGLQLATQKVPFQKFDVVSDSYPSTFDRYLITSFGFLGSTPKLLRADGSMTVSPFKSNLYSILGICRLILDRKDVTLCVFSRPSRVRFSNICYTLRFQDRRCVYVRSLTHNFYSDLVIRYRAMRGHWDKSLEPFARG